MGKQLNHTCRGLAKKARLVPRPPLSFPSLSICAWGGPGNETRPKPNPMPYSDDYNFSIPWRYGNNCYLRQEEVGCKGWGHTKVATWQEY